MVTRRGRYQAIHDFIQRSKRWKMPSAHSFAFRIFITGDSVRSLRAVDNLHELCAAMADDPTEVEVVDVLAEPERAEEEKVIATPTVMRLSPPPARRVIGDLADFGLAAAALGLRTLPRDAPSR